MCSCAVSFPVLHVKVHTDVLAAMTDCHKQSTIEITYKRKK